MAEDTDKRDAAVDEAADSGPRCGERLSEARERQGITVAEVAKELHLDEYKIRALEKNEFDVLGAPVFAKGHLKKYAALVGVNSDDVLADYYDETRASDAPPVVGAARKPAREIAAIPWLLAIAAVVVAATAYWFIVVAPVSGPADPQDTPPAMSDEGAGTAQSEPPDVDAVIERGRDPSTRVDPVPASNDSVAEEPSAGQERPAATSSDAVDEANDNEPQAEGPSADGDVRLSLRFSGDCWTEISDATGRRLFFGLARDGRRLDLSGPAPVSALFGNVSNVAIRVNGEDYAISVADRRGRTAQVTFEAP